MTRPWQEEQAKVTDMLFSLRVLRPSAREAQERPLTVKLILFALLTVPCFCQDTWGGLRFGMTPAQVRAVLKDRPTKSRTEPANLEFHTAELFFIDVQGVTIGQHKGIAHVGFDKEYTLDQVTLDFTSKDDAGCVDVLSEKVGATRSLLLNDISEKMTERFGAPVSESGVFPTSQELAWYYSSGLTNIPIKGERVWRAAGQVIDESFALSCDKAILIVSYKPYASSDAPSAPPYASGQIALTTAQIAKKASPSVVVIQGTTDSGDVLGSGFIVSKDGKIVTNLHVIRDMKTARVQLANGNAFDSLSVLATDEPRDLAIVQVAGSDLPILDLGDSDALAVGEPVVIVGSPRGLEGTVTAGILSSVRDSGDGFKVLQTDAAVNPGNSGGPLVNNKGQVVGVVSFKLRSAEGLNFAVPTNYVRALLGDLHEPLSLAQMRRGLVVTASTVEQNSGPSLKETLDWLNDTILLGTATFEYSHILSGQQVTQTVNVHNVTSNLRSCTVQFGSVMTSTTLEYALGLGEETVQYTVPLGALTEWYVGRQDNLERFAAVEAVTFLRGDRWSRSVFLKSKSKLISTARRTSFTIPGLAPNVRNTVESRDWLSITFNDESIAQRVATAFRHASELCRGKEPF